MVEYGYINENGCLTSKILELQKTYYRDSDDEIKERIITVEQQARLLEMEGWKPVDMIDESKMTTETGSYISLTPFDDGERIAYKYEKVFDRKELYIRINELKKQLSEGDYKIIKCYEASLVKEILPYDIEVLRSERQSVRQEINSLEEILLNN